MLLLNHTTMITILSSVVVEKNAYFTTFFADAILILYWVHKPWKVYKIVASKQKKLEEI
jgi:hypothetical protein